jgi:hypothetical protein
MDVDVSNHIVIAAPVAAVAAFASEPDNAPRWYVNIKSVEWRTPRPMGVEYVFRVVEFVPLRRLVVRMVYGPFAMETTYERESGDSSTRMTLRNRGTPSGFSRIVASFMSAAMRRSNRKDLHT